MTSQGKSAIEDHFDYLTTQRPWSSGKTRGKLDDLDAVRPKSAGQGLLYPSAAAAGPGSCRLVRPKLVGDEPLAVLLPDDSCWPARPVFSRWSKPIRSRRQHRGGRGCPPRAHQPLRHPGRRVATMAGWPRSRGWSKSRSRKSAFDPVDHRPLHPSARDVQRIWIVRSVAPATKFN